MSPEPTSTGTSSTVGRTATAAVRGAGWVSLGVGAQRAIQTGGLILLARLLVPEDFGLVAVAMLFLSFANRIKSLGLQTALLQYEGDIEAAADTALLLNAGLTAAVLLLIVPSSPLVSSWFGDARAGTVMAVMALRLVPQAVSAVPSALALREFRFRRLALIMAAESAVTLVVALVLAVKGLGAWALVAGSLGGATVAAVAWWLPPPWKPSLRLDRGASAGLLGTGVRIWSSGNLAFVIDSANRLFVGRFLGVATLGLYDVASRFVHAPLQSLVGITDRVVLPAFCREQENPEVLGRWLIRLTGLLVLVTAPAAGTLYFFGDVLVPVLIGSRWTGVVAPIRVLAPYVLLFPLLSMAPVYIATKNTDLLLRFTTVRSVVTIAGLFWASHVGLVAVCAVESAAAGVFALGNLWLVSRMLGLEPGQIGRMVAAPAGGLVAFAVVAVLSRMSGWGGVLGPAAAALVLPSVAFLGYAGAVVILRPGIMWEIRDLIAVATGVKAYR